ncbi:MAG: hypothetical protein U0T68_11130 [Ferruginibacter sp.]
MRIYETTIRFFEFQPKLYLQQLPCPPFISMQVNYFSKSFNTMMQNLSLLLQQLDRFVFPDSQKM